MILDGNLLEILVCPVCKGRIEYDKVEQELICYSDQLAFPVRDGIPVMLEGEARSLNTPSCGEKKQVGENEQTDENV